MKRYSDNVSVRSYDADQAGRLKPSSVFNYFQEAAWRHAEMLGFGYGALLERNLFWVLSRIYLEWDAPLRWGDEVVIETWPKGIHKLFALRDFVVRTESGTPAIRATSAWLTLDVESRRPRRPQDIMKPEVMLESEHAVEELPPKLAIGDELEPVDGRVARYSDLDVNRHVNNARYVDWIFDAVPPPDEASVAFSNLAVQFSGEARFGETVDILTGTADGAGLCHAAIVTRDARTHVCDATVTPARD